MEMTIFKGIIHTKMRDITHVVSMLLIPLMLGCSTNLDKRFNHLEDIIKESPDAKGALVTDDSEIMETVDYFRKHGGKEYYMKSLFYLGRVNANAGNTAKALSSYQKTIDLATKLHDVRYLGLCSFDIGRLYSNSYDDVSAIPYFEKAEQYFKECGDLHYAGLCTIERIRSLLALGKTDYAQDLAEHMEETDTTGMFYPMFQVLATHILSLKMEKPEKVIEILEDIGRDRLPLFAYSDLARSYLQTGRSDLALNMISSAIDASDNAVDSVTVFNDAYFINKELGYYKQALTHYENAVQMQDSIFVRMLKRSVSSAQRDILQQEAAIRKARSRTSNILFGFFATLLLLVIVFLVSRVFKHRKETIENMVRIEALTDDLDKTERRLDEATRAYHNLARDFLKKRITELSAISKEYFSSNDRKDKEQLIQLFEKQLLTLRNDKVVYSPVESVLNNYYDGIMDKLHAQFPDMKPKTSNILALMFIGMSYSDIALITRTHSLLSLKTFKSKYKSRFKNSGAPNAELFVKMLE